MTRLPHSEARDQDDHEVAQTSRAYDALARRYDDLLWQNPVLAHSARVSERLVALAMSNRRFLLEIGCGTGRETVKLAAMGKEIVACDPSRVSLEVLRQKAAALGLTHLIETRQLRASEVAGLMREVGPHVFDGAFSSFALSYDPQLALIPGQVWELLKPSSPFLCSIYNRLCLMEVVLFGPILIPRRGLRRLEGEAILPVDEFQVTVRSYFPSEVTRLFAPRFSLTRTWGIPAILPPHYLQILVRLSGGLRPAWEALDLKLNGKWPFRVLGSHTAYMFTSSER